MWVRDEGGGWGDVHPKPGGARDVEGKFVPRNSDQFDREGTRILYLLYIACSLLYVMYVCKYLFRWFVYFHSSIIAYVLEYEKKYR